MVGFLLGLLVGLWANVPPASAEEVSGARVRVTTERLDLAFSLESASPVAWRACSPSCAQADAGSGQSVRFIGSGDPPQLRMTLDGPRPPVDFQRLRFTAALAEDVQARIVTFQSDLPGEGLRLVKSFEVSKEGYEVVMTARLLGPTAAAFGTGRRLGLGLEAGHGLAPAPAAGFTAILDRVGRVVVGGGDVRVPGRAGSPPMTLGAGDWAGIRNRFWAIIVRPDGAATLESKADTGIALVAADKPDRRAWRYVFYSGPVEHRTLTRADPELGRLLFSGLWSWLRGLSFALLGLLRWLSAIVGSHGVAIVALALSVKVLLLPLASVADRLQQQVNATQARLQPRLDAINAAHKGEARMRHTLALYREEGVHPMYTLRSLVGFLIQIPVFIAVFDMLAENFDLYRVPFLWIQDLSRPDELARLPVCLPFFGCHLNLLPFLMAGMSVIALLRFHSPVLTPPLVRRQRRNLLGMTVLFFVLFYTFPAGMVLYWTSTNAVQVVGQELGRVTRLTGFRRRRAG